MNARSAATSPVEHHLPSFKPQRWLFLALWSFLTAVGSYLAWQTTRYWVRLLRQPALVSPVRPASFSSHAVIEAKAYAIAADNLRAGIEARPLPNGQVKRVLCAGSRNFREPWARDLGFASFGLLELEEYQATRESLEVFLINQHADGYFPVKVHSTNMIDRYLHSLLGREQPTRIPLRPKYRTGHNTISLDSTALLAIAVLNYAHQTADHDFALRYWPNLKRAVHWLEQHAREEDGLLHQSAFADWADSIARQGKVMYPNVLYWKILHDMAANASRYGEPGDEAAFTAKANHVRHSINEHFWRGDLGYYVTSLLFDNLSSSGNLLAVGWGLAAPAQANAILDTMDHFDMSVPVPTQVVHRSYPSRFIALENRLAGVGNYHTSAAWIWLGAWHVIALARMERVAEAEQVLYRMSRVIVRDGAVHEVYDPRGDFLSTFWYTSEAPLTWSAGMFVHAFHVFRRHLTSDRLPPEIRAVPRSSL